ncbi:MAG: FG-GAP-like repeat-containing protein [Cyclobacteriaceae bacterium]
MKKIIYIFFLALSSMALAQQPLINSIAPTHIEVGATVTISGSNLGGRVFFGGVEATSVSGTGNVMEAVVPAGVTHGSVTVLNNTLIAQSSQQFYISYVGSTITDYDTEYTLSSTETDANDICLCDLDGDALGLNDVAVAHSVADNSKSEISVYLNQSGPAGTATSFVKQANINNAENLSGFISTTCADLDNDGKPELIFTTNQGTNVKHIFIYRNQSTPGTISLTPLSALSLRLPNTSGSGNRISRVVRAADFDGDGKNDLAVGNDTDNTLHIFRNTSSGTGNFSFASPDEILADGDLSGVLGIADLNNDGRPDIISMPFRENSTRIHILKNRSIVGSLSFEAQASVTNGGQTNDVAAGDFDEDGLIDIVVVSRNTGLITTFRNSTSGSSITFDAGENISISSASPFGVDLGDINGDGKLDIISSFAVGNIVVVPNSSTSGNVSFGTEQQITTASTTQNVSVGDLNGDAKPDIAYTTDVSPGATGKLGVFMNRNCVAPVLSPLSTETSFCDTPDQFTITTTNSPGAMYNWEVTPPNNITGDGNNFITGVNSETFQIGSGATTTIRVTITSADGLCTTAFTEQTYTLDDAVPTTNPVIQVLPAGTLCAGDNVTISTAANNYDNYLWTLPDGSTQTSSTISLSPVQTSNAGTYSVRVRNSGDCSSDDVMQSIVVVQPPALQIFNNGNDSFCSDTANDPQLETSNLPGLTYQWKRNNGAISGATSSTYTADQTGDYSVEITDVNMCTNESDIYTVTELTEPVASLNGPTETCVNFATTFTSTSTVQSGFTAINDWTIVGTSPVTAPVNFTGDVFDVTLATEGTYQLTLTTSYDPTDVTACSNSVVRTVTVSPEPTITFDATDGTQKCQAESLIVGVTSPAAADIASYSWSVNGNVSTNATASASTLIGVDSVYAVLEITTTIGCTVKDSVKIKNFPTAADISSPDQDVSSDTVTLEEANSIVLTAENIVSGVAWSPSSIVDDSTATTVTVFPSTAMTTVTLTGIDANNCQVATTVTINLDNIRPRKTFSPNGDGLNDSWEILNTDVLNGCEIFIFDSRGRNILVKKSPFVNNEVWDGTSGGSNVPEGLYYFVLKCDDSDMSKSGSILLAR